MKHMLPVLFSSVLLSACHTVDGQALQGSVTPVAITQLSSQIDTSKGFVDIQITVSNRLPQDLKNIRVVMGLRDAQGNRLSGDDQTIEILGPIRRGQSIGPLDKVIPVSNGSRVCVEVKRIEAMTLDYSMLHVDGKDASAAVNEGSKNECDGSNA